MSRRRGLVVARFDVAGAVDDLRCLFSRADALACATERHLEQFTWPKKDDDDEGDGSDRRLWLEHLSHLLGATKEAVQTAVHGCGLVAEEVAKRGGRS